MSKKKMKKQTGTLKRAARLQKAKAWLIAYVNIAGYTSGGAPYEVTWE